MHYLNLGTKHRNWLIACALALMRHAAKNFALAHLLHNGTSIFSFFPPISLN